MDKYQTKGNNSAINENRVIALVDCTSTDHPLRMCEVSRFYFEYFRRYAPDKKVPKKLNKGE